MLIKVKRLVEAGFAVHRLHEKSKRPVGKDWSTEPVLSYDALYKLHRTGENLGVRLGQPSKVADGYLHVLDVDVRDATAALEAFETLEEMFPDYPTFPSVISGSRGPSRHFYIITPKAFHSKKLAHSGEKFFGQDGKKHWTWEIELFGTGKQVVLPPSIHPDTGKSYLWERPFDFDDLDLGFGPFVSSERIEKLVGESDEDRDIDTDDERQAPLGLDDEEIADILQRVPQADFCDDRDGWLTVGMALHHETGGSEKGFAMWCEFSKRSDKFDKKDQRRVWKSFKGNKKPTRMATLVSAVRDAELEAEIDSLDDSVDDLDEAGASEFENLDETSPEDLNDDLLGDAPAREPVSKREAKLNKAEVEHALGHVPPKIARINKKHALAFINGKTVVITENHGNQDQPIAYGTVGDLHNFYENDRVKTEKATEAVTKYWMRHKARRQYPNGVVFSPNKDVEGAYNHWQGFSVEPDEKASCKLFLKHCMDIVCQGDPKLYNYLMGFLAHMIQFPEEKPGVAIILRGRKGSGKDTVGNYVGALFPSHHVIIASQDHMTGRFNAHQERCLLLHLEEGFWAGNKQAEGTLKHVISSSKVMIESKGINAFSIKSVMRILMTSNEKWVAPATGDERRFFVTDVSDRYTVNKSTAAERREYFVNGILKEQKNGGLGALLYYLMHYDLSSFDIRDVPDTMALAEQKVQGLKNLDKWYFAMLQSGVLDFEFHSAKGDVADWKKEAIFVECEEFRHAYTKWMQRQRYAGDEMQSFEIGRQLNAMMPSLTTKRKRSAGRKRFYRFPTMDECRSEFETYLGSEFDWEPVDMAEPVKGHEDDADDLDAPEDDESDYGD